MAVKLHTICLLLWLLLPCNAQIFAGSKLRTLIQPVPGVSDACNSTFSTELKCEPIVQQIAFSRYSPSADDLASTCTSDCLQSLSCLQYQQQQACANDMMTLGSTSYPITATVDALIWAFKYSCYKDSGNRFCYPTFDSWASGNSPQSACTDCVLGTYQLSLNSSLRYNSDASASFSALTSSCQATGYSLTAPARVTSAQTTSASTTAPVKASPTCYSTYTVANGDDCHSISKAQNVSTANMLYLNNLQAGCADFPQPGTLLCMPHACNTYTVQPGDNCWSISQAYGGITKSQIVSWNIDVDSGCDNLEMLIGNQICVSYPGDAMSGAPGDAASSTVAPAPTNIADNTNRQCSKYYTVQTGDTCAVVTQAHSLSLKDFYFLNPIINSTSCDNLWLGIAYCVRSVGDIRSYPGYDGRSDNPCVGADNPAETCFATTYDAGPAWTFPRVTYTSANLTYTDGGGSGTTTSHSSPPTTAVSTTSSSAMSTTPTSTGPVAPGPVQSGQPTDCNKWVLQQSGEYCAGMAKRAGISLSCLYQMNPALNSGGECQGVWFGYAYCSSTMCDLCT